MTDEDVFWVRTVGAPSADDPRDGELHRFTFRLPERFDLEPWDEDDDSDETDVSRSARYVRSDQPPSVDEEGRTVWLYEYRPK
jgi:hypothetical protein